MTVFRYHTDGEPAIWWRSQILGSHERPWDHWRGWLNFPGNTLGVEWSRRGNFRLDLTFADSATGDHAITLLVGLPWLFNLWIWLERAKWVERLPGVEFVSGDYGSGERELSICTHDGYLWWRLWRNPNYGKSKDWRDGAFNPANFFLGRAKYSEYGHNTFESFVELPEGRYPVTIKIYRATWKRPRWYKARTVQRADIKCEAGVPIPGKGENSWDQEDDRLYEVTCLAGTVEEAKAAFVDSVMERREKYG